MVITCGISFIMLNNLPYCKEEHISESTEVDYFSEPKPTLNYIVKNQRFYMYLLQTVLKTELMEKFQTSLTIKL